MLSRRRFVEILEFQVGYVVYLVEVYYNGVYNWIDGYMVCLNIVWFDFIFYGIYFFFMFIWIVFKGF